MGITFNIVCKGKSVCMLIIRHMLLFLNQLPFTAIRREKGIGLRCHSMNVREVQMLCQRQGSSVNGLSPNDKHFLIICTGGQSSV